MSLALLLRCEALYNAQKSQKEHRTFLEIFSAHFSEYFIVSGSSLSASDVTKSTTNNLDEIDDSEFEGDFLERIDGSFGSKIDLRFVC